MPSALEEQEWENTVAIADEAGLRGQAFRMAALDMPVNKIRDAIVDARDRQNPYARINWHISDWRDK